MTILRNSLSIALYPALVTGSVLGAAMLLEVGLPPAVVPTIVFLVVLGAVALGERLHPHIATWNRATDDVKTDIWYLVTAWIPQSAARVVAESLAVIVAMTLGALLGPRPWLADWPMWAQALLALLLADLGKYWLHRLAHERDWLWPFHAAHHSPSRLYSLNGIRIHPVNMLWNLSLDIVVPLALGLDTVTIAMAASLRLAVSVLQHANIELRLGPLNFVFSTPTLHQWHHSRVLAEGNRNYGSTFIVWDVLFGTRFLPRHRTAPTALGLVSKEPHPSTFLGQILWPFCREKIADCRLLVCCTNGRMSK